MQLYVMAIFVISSLDFANFKCSSGSLSNLEDDATFAWSDSKKASCMAAAALADLSGGSADQSVGAASMALQNTIGLVCDPVADRVEVPCLGRNVAAGLNALGTSTMALSGFNEVIPFDQVLDAVIQVGRSIPFPLRCTGKGRLSVTAKSRELKKNNR